MKRLRHAIDQLNLAVAPSARDDALKQVRDLLGLGDSASAQVEASRYLAKWSQADGFLDKVTIGKPHYTLRPPAV